MSESVGIEHTTIKGTKLPTAEQVLMCFLANIKKLREEDTTKQKILTNAACHLVIKSVGVQYIKAKIETKAYSSMKRDILKLYESYNKVKKLTVTKAFYHLNIH